MKKLDMSSINFCDENIQKIADIFPNVITEAKDENGNTTKAIDFELLKQELSCFVVDGNKERYSINWPGKKEAILKANQPINKTLRPIKEDSKDFDNTKNLYIEGDNLEAIKLLQKSYLGAIKMIYIDPPYNTGKDFIYKDNFTRNKEEELKESGQIDEDGGRLVTNLDSNGRYHSDWLSMMYPRLKLARNLLKDDGVIFISIDDNEVHNLRKICDEIFGEDNFVGELKWKRKKQPSYLATHIAGVMEYIIIFAKNKDNLEKLSIEGTTDITKKVINISNAESERIFKAGVRVKLGDEGIIKAGKYKIKTMTVEYKNDVAYKNGKTLNEVKVISRFLNTQENIDKFIEEDLLFISKNLGLRRDVSEKDLGKRKSITDLLLEWGDNQESDKEQLELLGSSGFFDYTKPTLLIKNFIKSLFSKNELILDFFSGSATTAHAVMQLNAEDGGNRKFIMVQIPEPTDPKSEAYKAGYKNICEIGKERIRRAGEKIVEENKDKENIKNLDIGFRVLKVDSSNMKDIYYTPQETNKNSLFNSIDNIKEDRTPLDLLFQVLLDSRVELSDKIETKVIKEKEVYFVDENSLVACFEDNLNEEFIRELANELKDKDILRVVFKDTAFERDDLKDNVEQIFKQICPNTEVWAI